MGIRDSIDVGVGFFFVSIGSFGDGWLTYARKLTSLLKTAPENQDQICCIWLYHFLQKILCSENKMKFS